MNRRLSFAALALSMFSPIEASAQSQYQSQPNWSGPYLGASIGAGSAKAIWSGADLGKIDTDSGRSFIGGLQGGYNFQNGSIVAGVEADYLFGALKGTSACAGGLASCSSSLNNLGSVRGRLGWAFTPPAMLYFTGGLAWGSTEWTTTTSGLQSSLTQTKAGTVFGGGVEFLLTKNWTLKAEYLRYDLGKFSTMPGDLATSAVDAKSRADTFKLGINFKF